MTMAGYDKPLPEISEANEPFWSALREHRLVMQRCSECAHIRYPISPYCAQCLSGGFDWAELSGDGEIYSYIVFHQVYNEAFADDVPYNVALVQMCEGPRMFSNIVGVPNDQPRVGDPVSITFDEVTDEVTLPRFRLTAAAGA
ncbi:MAG: hypothetical protein GEV07_14145 [Streptosporangiales bacterium]|nr:hypothetical protein [Streptosporangiales bacterium]